MSQLLDRALALAEKAWLRLTSPSEMRMLAPLIAAAAAWLAARWWRRAGRSPLGRAARWWSGALVVAAVLAGTLYTCSALPDDPEVAAAVRHAAYDRLGRTTYPAPIAAGASCLAAAALLWAGWRWRQGRQSPAERAALAAAWHRVRRRWLRRGAWSLAGLAGLAATACAAAALGAPQVPPLAGGFTPSSRGGALWVAGAGGVSQLTTGSAGATWRSFAWPRAPLPSNQAKQVATGPAGQVWFGTTNGLVQYAPGERGAAWRTFTPDDSPLPSGHVLGLVIDRRGVVWAATEKGGAVLERDRPGRGFTERNAPLLHQVLDAVYVDQVGRVWFGGAGGVNVYQPPASPDQPDSWPVGFTRYTTDGALPDDLVFTIFGDSHGRVWFGTLEGAAVLDVAAGEYGLGAFDRARWQIFTPRNSPLPHAKVHSIAEDRQGRIWLGTEGGVAVLDETAPPQSPGRWQVFRAGPGQLPHPWAQALLVAPDGRIWAGTRGGLAVFDPAHPAAGWSSYHAHPVRRWAGLLWPAFWKQNLLPEDISALAWAP